MRLSAFSGIRRPVIAGITFFSTVCVLSVGYAAWNASMPTATSGGTLTATAWNAVVGNVDDLNTRVMGLSSIANPWIVSGGNISYTGARVGIGTANPAGILHIHQSGFGGIYFASDSTDNWIESTNNAANGSRNMTISGHSAWLIPTLTLKATNTYATGNVGIGTNTPQKKLDVAWDISVLSNSYLWSSPNSGSNVGQIKLHNSTSGDMEFSKVGGGTFVFQWGNVRNSTPSQGYIELSGNLPGYAVNTYPTVRTSFTNLYFSAGGVFSAYMTQGGTWTVVSDKNKKDNITQLDYREILKKIDALPITQWNYKTEDADTKHIGPFAQDFHALFGLNGPNDKMISTTDPSGVALAGIKGLSEKSKEQESRISEVEKKNQELAKQNQELKSLVCLDYPEAPVCRQ